MAQDIFVGEGKYILGKRLGGGSFGEIYLGINKHTREFVAIKLVTLLHARSFLRNRRKRASTCS